jgi:hypothetical protein
LPDLSSKLSDYSKATIRLNPNGYLRQIFISWWNFWKTNLYLNEVNFKSKNAKNFYNSLWFIEHFPLRLFKLFFLLTIPFQLIVFFKEKKIEVVFLFTIMIFVTSILQALVTYGTNSRFSYPFEFLIVVIVLAQGKKCYQLLKK